MAVVFELIDAPYPHVCALYRCSCGAEAARSGTEAAVPPPGWIVEHPAGRADDDDDVICPRCGARSQRPS